MSASARSTNPPLVVPYDAPGTQREWRMVPTPDFFPKAFLLRGLVSTQPSLGTTPPRPAQPLLGNSSDTQRARPKSSERPSRARGAVLVPGRTVRIRPPVRRQGPDSQVSRPEFSCAASRGRLNPPNTHIRLCMCFNVVNGQLNELQFVIFMVNLKSRSCWLILLVGGKTRRKSCCDSRGSNRHFM